MIKLISEDLKKVIRNYMFTVQKLNDINKFLVFRYNIIFIKDYEHKIRTF